MDLMRHEERRQDDEDTLPFISGLLDDDTPDDAGASDNVDEARLEAAIAHIFSTTQLKTKCATTFVGILAAGSSVHLLRYWGVSTLASGGLAGIILAVFLCDALSHLTIAVGSAKWSVETRSDLAVSIGRTVGVSGSLWLAFREQMENERIAKVGKTRFYEEVARYEVKPQGEPNYVGYGIALALSVLVVATITRLLKR